MKLIIAVIQPHRLEAVKRGPGRRRGLPSHGHGRAGLWPAARPDRSLPRARVRENLLRKVQLMIAVNEEFLEPTIDAIIRGGARAAGEIGDGKIFVLDLEDCIRIRTGERGGEAI